jgi:hypothetical protein
VEFTFRTVMALRTQVLVFCLLLVTPAWSKVLVRWTQPAVPTAKTLGVNQLVVGWSPNAPDFLKTARRQGYEVYVQARPEQVAQVASAAQDLFAGVIIEISPSEQAQADEIVKKFRVAYPRLKFSILDPNGKQPEMKGTMVVKREGVLEITSPTAQPWIDSNVPLVRFARGFRPTQVPLYTFQWDTSDPLQQSQGPSAENYSLAIAEANALHADLVLNVHDKLQQGLLANEAAAWKLWNEVRAYVKFGSRPLADWHPEANIAVVTDSYDSAYEPMNLMARHNIAFRVLPIRGLSVPAIAGLKVLLLFAAPNPQEVSTVENFAAAGGTAVLVGVPGSYSWQTSPANRLAEHSMAYAVGKGRIIELAEPVSDPETFAQDVRRLMKEPDVLFSLWNALTTIGVPYRNTKTGEMVAELVNYSGEPMRVQGRVKGSFRTIRYETPERTCCEALKPALRNGFTEFIAPSVTVAGRVHIKSGKRSPVSY